MSEQKNSDMTQKLLNLTTEEVHELNEALRFFCPSSVECNQCPLYAGFGDTFPLTPCLAIQADLELTRRMRNAK